MDSAASLEAGVCVPTECLPCWRWMQLGGQLLRLLFPFCNCRVCESLIIASWGSGLLPQQRACCLVFVISALFFFPPSASPPFWDCLLLTLGELGLLDSPLTAHAPHCPPGSHGAPTRQPSLPSPLVPAHFSPAVKLIRSPLGSSFHSASAISPRVGHSVFSPAKLR